MNGRRIKEWYRYKPRPSKDDISYAKEMIRFGKPVARAIKFVKRAMREMRKGDPNSECGLWYDEHNGFGYYEFCRAGGLCSDSHCPYALAKSLLKALSERSER